MIRDAVEILQMQVRAGTSGLGVIAEITDSDMRQME
jgi:hypothetical protein